MWLQRCYKQKGIMVTKVTLKQGQVIILDFKTAPVKIVIVTDLY